MIQTKEILERMLADLQNQLQKANNELAGSPTGSLVRVKRGKGYMIFRVYSEQGKRVRKVITQNEEMINALARKVYLKAEADILQRDIEAASAFLQIFEEPVFDNIIRHIPERFLQYKLSLIHISDSRFGSLIIKLSDSLDYLKYFTLNTLFDTEKILSDNGFEADFAVLGALALILYGTGIIIFFRRDLPL